MKLANLTVLALALSITACTPSVQPIAQNGNTANAPSRNDRPQTAIAHGPQNQNPPAVAQGEKSKWTQSGDPIDTTKFDTAVMAAEKALAAKPADAAAKQKLAGAFLERATALTEARQYAAALGDYRKTLKHDPTNADAKQWIDQITMIYSSINRASPAEGEEPPPLPFKKG